MLIAYFVLAPMGVPVSAVTVVGALALLTLAGRWYRGEGDRSFFRFDDAELAGYGGLEGDGTDRLLRSLVVVPDRRREGIGRAMLAALEREAIMRGVERLHLLTTTAAEFFKANGYTVADRLTAPAPIATSREFTSLCPATAAYLVKTLDPA